MREFTKFHYLILLACLSLIALISHIQKSDDKGLIARRLAEKAYKEAHEDNSSASAEIVLRESDFFFFNNKSIKNCHINAQESKIFPNQEKTECRGITCTLTIDNDTVAVIKAPLAYLQNKNKSILFPKETLLISTVKTGEISIKADSAQANVRDCLISLSGHVESIVNTRIVNR
jgi:hypothetical protein